MHIEELREYCLSKPWTSEGLPFDKSTLVFYVGKKMFALTSLESFEFVNLKCDPERAIELRETFDGIKPGWHMSKAHWNSVYCLSDVDDNLLKDLIDHSYSLVYKSLPKKVKDELQDR